MGSPTITYVGMANGIGDSSNPIAYDLRCGCGVLLGCLGIFKPNPEGQRSSYCPKCKHATCVSATGQILSYTPYDITKSNQTRPT